MGAIQKYRLSLSYCPLDDEFNKDRVCNRYGFLTRLFTFVIWLLLNLNLYLHYCAVMYRSKMKKRLIVAQERLS